MNCLVRNVRLQDIIFSKAGTIKLSFKAKRYFEQSWKSLNYFDNLFLQIFFALLCHLKKSTYTGDCQPSNFTFCRIITWVRYPITVRRYISISRYESSDLNKFRYLAATNSVTKSVILSSKFLSLQSIFQIHWFQFVLSLYSLFLCLSVFRNWQTNTQWVSMK